MLKELARLEFLDTPLFDTLFDELGCRGVECLWLEVEKTRPSEPGGTNNELD